MTAANKTSNHNNNNSSSSSYAAVAGAGGATSHSHRHISGAARQSLQQLKNGQRRWTSVHDQYKTIDILGQGTYGVVYKAESKTTGEPVAMKRCRLDAFREFGIPETTLREISLLRDLRHENIMSLYHISCNTERLYLICEYLDLDLKKYIRSNPRGIPVSKVKQISYELFKGLAFCHGHRVIHRDLKPHNVLISADISKVKIADFGLARSALAPGKTLTHEVVTLWYRSPELLLGHCNYTSGVDIWSAGCILVELFTSKPLYVGDSEIDTLFKIFRLLGTPSQDQWPEHAVVRWEDFPKFSGKPDPFGSLLPNLDSAGKDLLTRVFQFNSADRISALDALQHPWFDDIRAATVSSGTAAARRRNPVASAGRSLDASNKDGAAAAAALVFNESAAGLRDSEAADAEGTEPAAKIAGASATTATSGAPGLLNPSLRASSGAVAPLPVRGLNMPSRPSDGSAGTAIAAAPPTSVSQMLAPTVSLSVDEQLPRHGVGRPTRACRQPQHAAAAAHRAGTVPSNQPDELGPADHSNPAGAVSLESAAEPKTWTAVNLLSMSGAPVATAADVALRNRPVPRDHPPHSQMSQAPAGELSWKGDEGGSSWNTASDELVRRRAHVEVLSRPNVKLIQPSSNHLETETVAASDANGSSDAVNPGGNGPGRAGERQRLDWCAAEAAASRLDGTSSKIAAVADHAPHTATQATQESGGAETVEAETKRCAHKEIPEIPGGGSEEAESVRQLLEEGRRKDAVMASMSLNTEDDRDDSQVEPEVGVADGNSNPASKNDAPVCPPRSRSDAAKSCFQTLDEREWKAASAAGGGGGNSVVAAVDLDLSAFMQPGPVLHTSRGASDNDEGFAPRQGPRPTTSVATTVTAPTTAPPSPASAAALSDGSGLDGGEVAGSSSDMSRISEPSDTQNNTRLRADLRRGAAVVGPPAPSKLDHLIVPQKGGGTGGPPTEIAPPQKGLGSSNSSKGPTAAPPDPASSTTAASAGSSGPPSSSTTGIRAVALLGIRKLLLAAPGGNEDGGISARALDSSRPETSRQAPGKLDGGRPAAGATWGGRRNIADDSHDSGPPPRMGLAHMQPPRQHRRSTISFMFGGGGGASEQNGKRGNRLSRPADEVVAGCKSGTHDSLDDGGRRPQAACGMAPAAKEFPRGGGGPGAVGRAERNASNNEAPPGNRNAKAGFSLVGRGDWDLLGLRFRRSASGSGPTTQRCHARSAADAPAGTEEVEARCRPGVRGKYRTSELDSWDEKSRREERGRGAVRRASAATESSLSGDSKGGGKDWQGKDPTRTGAPAVPDTIAASGRSSVPTAAGALRSSTSRLNHVDDTTGAQARGRASEGESSLGGECDNAVTLAIVSENAINARSRPNASAAVSQPLISRPGQSTRSLSEMVSAVSTGPKAGPGDNARHKAARPDCAPNKDVSNDTAGARGRGSYSSRPLSKTGDLGALEPHDERTRTSSFHQTIQGDKIKQHNGERGDDEESKYNNSVGAEIYDENVADENNDRNGNDEDDDENCHGADGIEKIDSDSSDGPDLDRKDFNNFNHRDGDEEFPENTCAGKNDLSALDRYPPKLEQANDTAAYIVGYMGNDVKRRERWKRQQQPQLSRTAQPNNWNSECCNTIIEGPPPRVDIAPTDGTSAPQGRDDAIARGDSHRLKQQQQLHHQQLQPPDPQHPVGRAAIRMRNKQRPRANQQVFASQQNQWGSQWDMVTTIPTPTGKLESEEGTDNIGSESVPSLESAPSSGSEFVGGGAAGGTGTAHHPLHQPLTEVGRQAAPSSQLSSGRAVAADTGTSTVYSTAYLASQQEPAPQQPPPAFRLQGHGAASVSSLTPALQQLMLLDQSNRLGRIVGGGWDQSLRQQQQQQVSQISHTKQQHHHSHLPQSAFVQAGESNYHQQPRCSAGQPQQLEQHRLGMDGSTFGARGGFNNPCCAIAASQFRHQQQSDNGFNRDQPKEKRPEMGRHLEDENDDNVRGPAWGGWRPWRRHSGHADANRSRANGVQSHGVSSLKPDACCYENDYASSRPFYFGAGSQYQNSHFDATTGGLVNRSSTAQLGDSSNGRFCDGNVVNGASAAEVVPIDLMSAAAPGTLQTDQRGHSGSKIASGKPPVSSAATISDIILSSSNNNSSVGGGANNNNNAGGQFSSNNNNNGHRHVLPTGRQFYDDSFTRSNNGVNGSTVPPLASSMSSASLYWSNSGHQAGDVALDVECSFHWDSTMARDAPRASAAPGRRTIGCIPSELSYYADDEDHSRRSDCAFRCYQPGHAAAYGAASAASGAPACSRLQQQLQQQHHQQQQQHRHLHHHHPVDNKRPPPPTFFAHATHEKMFPSAASRYGIPSARRSYRSSPSDGSGTAASDSGQRARMSLRLAAGAAFFGAPNSRARAAGSLSARQLPQRLSTGDRALDGPTPALLSSSSSSMSAASGGRLPFAQDLLQDRGRYSGMRRRSLDEQHVARNPYYQHYFYNPYSAARQPGNRTARSCEELGDSAHRYGLLDEPADHFRWAACDSELHARRSGVPSRVTDECYRSLARRSGPSDNNNIGAPSCLTRGATSRLNATPFDEGSSTAPLDSELRRRHYNSRREYVGYHHQQQQQKPHHQHRFQQQQHRLQQSGTSSDLDAIVQAHCYHQHHHNPQQQQQQQLRFESPRGVIRTAPKIGPRFDLYHNARLALGDTGEVCRPSSPRSRHHHAEQGRGRTLFTTSGSGTGPATGNKFDAVYPTVEAYGKPTMSTEFGVRARHRHDPYCVAADRSARFHHGRSVEDSHESSVYDPINGAMWLPDDLIYDFRNRQSSSNNGEGNNSVRNGFG